MQRLALLVAATIASAAAFAPTPALTGLRQQAPLCSGNKLSAACRAPRAAKPAMTMSLAETTNQAMLLAEGGMNVSVAAYLAVLLGTFIPVVFLLTLYIQSESRKAAETGSEGDKF
ncbi:hypothetical protein GUITHDRAFT_155667 [Guillardia theta CCMP2712]|uniref:Photosystem II reaction center M n=3 Tax=Guillardia theta TaxID=55529 RepID=L1IFP3_GUITC|nr:hypothetical protein GUITHDRAFT_155667 [Guillardia theta CCMP2712]EKX34729.1 hypothetical protein GUITHDRAFT_155667 [Guillardia theta CCMP2712]|eukprot:XP_005821709.1 hypothetical protein GUITHDRAFT_155667 [Guillardia theta CCMP2712]